VLFFAYSLSWVTGMRRAHWPTRDSRKPVFIPNGQPGAPGKPRRLAEVYR